MSKVVIEYLSKRGYNRTEAMLRLEIAKQGFSHADAELDSLAGSAGQYERIYVVLRDWIEASLDLYKPELYRVLYPVFVHSYLDLVQRGDYEAARAYFAAHAQEHETLHEHEVRQLAKISLAEHLYEHNIAGFFRKNKYRVVLSRTSLDLMLHLLHEHESIGGKGVIRIINQYLAIQTSSAPYGAAGAFDGIAGLDVGQSETFNQQPVQLGLPPMSKELAQDVQAELLEDDRKADQLGQPTLISTFAAKLKADEETAVNAPSREAIPLPPCKGVDVMAEVENIKDLTKRLQVGPQASLPSVCMFTFHNTHDGLNCLTFSEDTKLVAGGFEESYIKIWSLNNEPLQTVADNDDKDSRTSRRLISHAGPVYGVSFSPDSRYFLSCSEDRSARLWSMETLTCLAAYKGHNQPVWDVAFGPFGHYFATASHDYTAKLWSCDHIYPLRIFAGHLSDVDTLAFHPNSAYLATGSTDKTCRLWDIQRGNPVRVFTGHTAAVTATCISPNGKYLASGADDGGLIIWDLAAGKPLKTMRGAHKRSPIYTLDFSRESMVLVSGGADNTVRVWDVNSSDDDKQEQAETSSQMASFATRRTPVYKLHFTRRNLCLAGGAYVP